MYEDVHYKSQSFDEISGLVARVEFRPNTPTENPMASYRNLCTGLALSLASATNAAQDPVAASIIAPSVFGGDGSIC